MKIKNEGLVDRGYAVKKRFLAMYERAGAGHIACSLSCAEILVFLRFGWMKEEDELILSKGHAAAALYSVLAEYGSVKEDEIKTFYQDGTYFGAHPPANKIKGIPFATGSLGHGLPIAAGMALASRLKNEDRSIFCLTSDGELNEGSTWEAALFISYHKINNLIWLIDRNNIQGFGRSDEVLGLEPLDKKLRSFGFYVIHADGHGYDSLIRAKEKCLINRDSPKPRVVICRTIKGKGVSYMENTVDWHYLPMDDEQYRLALKELALNYNRQKMEGI